MLSDQVLKCLRLTLPVLVKRDFAILAPALGKPTDPIQQIFLEKLQEYNKKSTAAGGKLFDVSPDIQRELSAELEKVAKQFGGKDGADMTKFPPFQFKDPNVEPINLQQ